MTKLTGKNIALIGIFTAILCVVSPLTIPLGVAPLSLTTMALFLVSILLGRRLGCISVLAYIILGGVGLPVFSGFTGGLAALTSITGGYIIGYIFFVFLIDLIVEKGGGKNYFYPVAMAISTIILYVIAVVYYVGVYGVSVKVAIVSLVVPFILTDAIKIIVCSIIAVSLKRYGIINKLKNNL